MNSTSTVAVIIQAVLAGSSLGGSAAPARGAASSNSAGRKAMSDRNFMRTPPKVGAWPHPKQAYLLLGRDVLGVEAEAAARAVGEPVAQRQAHGAEGDLLPRHPVFLHQPDLQAFLAGLEAEVEDARPVKEVHLV